MQMPVMSCSSKNTKAHFEKHVIITTIVRAHDKLILASVKYDIWRKTKQYSSSIYTSCLYVTVLAEFVKYDNLNEYFF